MVRPLGHPFSQYHCRDLDHLSQASPMAHEMTHATAAAAAGLVGLISIANGSGRLLWAWLSDFVGRRQVFLTMFPLQAVVLGRLSQATASEFSPFSRSSCCATVAALAPCRPWLRIYSGLGMSARSMA
jgi:MFS family permease